MNRAAGYSFAIVLVYCVAPLAKGSSGVCFLIAAADKQRVVLLSERALAEALQKADSSAVRSRRCNDPR